MRKKCGKCTVFGRNRVIALMECVRTKDYPDRCGLSKPVSADIPTKTGKSLENGKKFYFKKSIVFK